MLDERSKANLLTVNPKLRAVIEKAEEVGKFNIVVTCGFRDEETQNMLFNVGKSKLKWPKSDHNYLLDGVPYSNAVDLAFKPVNWHNINLWHYFAGFILGVSYAMGTPFQWGGDFDNDNILTDDDYCHFALIEK